MALKVSNDISTIFFPFARWMTIVSFSVSARSASRVNSLRKFPEGTAIIKRLPSTGGIAQPGMVDSAQAANPNEAKRFQKCNIAAFAACFVDAERIFYANFAGRHINVFVRIEVAENTAGSQFCGKNDTHIFCL